MEHREWFDKMAPYAIGAFRKYGIPPSLTLAQAALESAYGERDCGGVFNYFGFKGTGPAGKTVLDTHEYIEGKKVRVKAGFRKYHNPQEAFEDHNRLLAESAYYAKAREAKPDSVAMAHALTGVYATDPNYGKKLEWIIDRYNLKKFDPQPPLKGNRWQTLWRIIQSIGGKRERSD